MSDKEEAAAARASGGVDRSAPPVGRTAASEGDELRHSTPEVVLQVAEAVSAIPGLVVGAKYVGGKVADAVVTKIDGDHKAEKGDG